MTGKFRKLQLFYLAFIVNTACQSGKMKMIHLDFCDFVNNVSSQLDKAHGKIAMQESLHYVVDGRRSAFLADSDFVSFINKDLFIQREKKKYSDLDVIFYRKSDCTEELLQAKNSRKLDFCGNDIITEYLWRDGVIWDTLHYQNGVIDGAKDIKLVPVK